MQVCQNAKAALGAGVSSEGCCWLLKRCDSPLAFFILFRGLKSLKIRKQNYKLFKGYLLHTVCIYICVCTCRRIDGNREREVKWSGVCISAGSLQG